MQQHPQLQQIIMSAIELAKYELVGVEIIGGSVSPHVRIYIDATTGGITIADISLLSKQIKAVIDVAKFFIREYTLEVSSPGLSRPLFTVAQFRQHLGKNIKIKCIVPIEGQHNFKGKLSQVAEDKITLALSEQQIVDLSFSDIVTAKIIPEIIFCQQHCKHEANG